MAMSQLEQDTVSRSMQAAKLILNDLQPVLDSINVIYNSAGGCKETITQQELDQVASFSGLTKGQLDDGVYALTASILNSISTAYAQLVQLAARA